MAKLSFCELPEYDTKGLEGIQSSDYLMEGIECFSRESASLVQFISRKSFGRQSHNLR